ncbi:hypothetical protein M3Y96_00573300 [Aphelenchoides besseyi]|nr:hypothetical protein M3Y96_00573300 [Aphelenchoides besseyi]
MRVSILLAVSLSILYFPSTPDGIPIPQPAINSTDSARDHIDDEIVFLTSPNETSQLVITNKKFWIPFLIFVCMFVCLPMICFCCWCCDQNCGCCKDNDRPKTCIVLPKYVDENNNTAEEEDREYENLRL